MLGVPGVGARGAQRPPRLALVAGVADVVVGLIHLPGALERVAGRAEVRAEAADVHLPHVHRRLALEDPLGHHAADPAGAREAVRAEAGRDEQPAHLALAQAELVVGGERLGSVDQAGDCDLVHHRHALARVGRDLLEARPVLLQQAAVEV